MVPGTSSLFIWGNRCATMLAGSWLVETVVAVQEQAAYENWVAEGEDYASQL